MDDVIVKDISLSLSSQRQIEVDKKLFIYEE